MYAVEKQHGDRYGSDSSGSNSPTAFPSKPWIEYRTDYVNNRSGILFKEIHTESRLKRWSHDHPVLEVVDVMLSAQSDMSRSKGGELLRPSTYGRGRSYIQINSPAIIDALRAVVDHYPEHSFAGETIALYFPYAVIIHYEQELESYRSHFTTEAINEIPKSCENADTHEHVGLLLQAVRERTINAIERERQRYMQNPPRATFEMLWLMLKPGADVFCDHELSGEYEPYVVKSVTQGHLYGTCIEYTVILWCLSADENYIGPKEIRHKLSRFDGEKHITSLEIFPAPYWNHKGDGKSFEERRQELIERGKLFHRLCRKGCWRFDGYTSTWPRRKYKSLVIADLIGLSMDVDVDSRARGAKLPKIVDDIERQSAQPPSCQCQRCSSLQMPGARESRFAGYTQINSLSENPLTDHQYFICTSTFCAFVLKVRAWEELQVQYFQDPVFDMKMIDSLILKNDAKSTLQSLVKMYISTSRNTSDGASGSEAKRAPWSADTVQGKGDGLIMLLHGAPGVGKTYTAECIAEFTERPLLSLSTADIGTSPEDIDSGLRYWFKLAQSWDAILLIDEADVYMEDRDVDNLSRSSIVASFLRAMDYFEGILFLTTNRIGRFDEAILSRVHLQFFYDKFDEQQRQEVWQVFLKKLEQDKQSEIRVDWSATDYIKNSPDLKELEWNGREIRNAFQIAVNLAAAENDRPEGTFAVVRAKHIEQPVKLSKDFKAYMRKLYKMPESNRARHREIRYDE